MFSYTKLTGLVVRAVALTLVFTVAACDGSEDLSDAELIVGSWDLSGVVDGAGDQMASFNQNYSSFAATFNSDGSVTIVLVPTGTAPDVNINATYTIDEANGTVGITTTVSGLLVTIPFTYDFTDEDTLELTASAALLGQVLQTSLSGTATVTLTRD